MYFAEQQVKSKRTFIAVQDVWYAMLLGVCCSSRLVARRHGVNDDFGMSLGWPNESHGPDGVSE